VDNKDMSVRVTLYLKSNSGPKPYRSCYFSEREYARLMKDFTRYRENGAPATGTYTEEISGSDEQSVVVAFGDLAEIRSNQ
jgi:hypothetical protein